MPPWVNTAVENRQAHLSNVSAGNSVYFTETGKGRDKTQSNAIENYREHDKHKGALKQQARDGEEAQKRRQRRGRQHVRACR